MDDPQIMWIMGLENIALCESKIQYQVYEGWLIRDDLMLINELCFKYFLHLIA